MRHAAAFLAMLLLPACSLLGATATASLDSATLDRQDARRLTIQGMHGSCDTVLEPEVVEGPEQVVVTVPLRLEAGGCDDRGVLLDVPVQLQDPLGDRPVVDARTGNPLPVIGRDRPHPGPS